MVRYATADDVPQLAILAGHFLRESTYAAMLPFDEDGIKLALSNMVANGVVLVAERNGVAVGFLAGIMSAVWFCPSATVATEMAWWVSPDVRGGSPAAVRLVREFERWAGEHNADYVVMSDIVTLDSPAASMLSRMGYHTVERSHLKELE